MPVAIPLEILAATLMDIRATVESMRRSVTNAQSSVEQFRHTTDVSRLDDIADCLEQLRKESAIVTHAATLGDDSILALRDDPPAASS